MIDGRYRVDRLVGSGGFGTVYAGLALAIELPIAVKVLRAPGELSAPRRMQLLSSFVDEARILGRLRHDGIVRTIDQGILQDGVSGEPTPYLVMEWAGDNSLRSLLRAHGALPLAQAWVLVERITAAVAHAHKSQIVHRDLKPNNVMLQPNDEGELSPRVIDFGIAKWFDGEDLPGAGGTLTRTGHTAFTPAYAAPEQIASARTGPWTDVHALGLLFTEMVTGRLPYGDDDSAGLVAIDPQRPTPGRLGVDVGPFETVIERALALRPNERFADAGELLVALRAAAHTAGVGQELGLAPLSEKDLPSHRGGAELSPRDPTAPSMTRTVRVDETPRRPRAGSTLLHAPPRVGRRAVVGAAGALVASGALALWWSRATARFEPAAPPDPTAAPPEVAAPPAPVRLSDLTMADLEARAQRAGLSITNRTEHKPKMFLLSFLVGDTWGSIHLTEMLAPRADMSHAELRHAFMPYLGMIVRNYQDAGFRGVAYGLDGNTSLLVAYKLEQTTIELFDQIVAGIPLDVRGNTVKGPDPASIAAPPRGGPVPAVSLATLSVDELRSRMLRAGVEKVEVAQPAEHPAVMSFQLGGKQGKVELHYARPDKTPAVLDQRVDALAKEKPPGSFARDGGALLVVAGEPGLDRARLLRALITGLTVQTTSPDVAAAAASTP